MTTVTRGEGGLARGTVSEDDLAMLLHLLDFVSEGQHGRRGRIAQFCEETGTSRRDLARAIRRVSAASGWDLDWSDE